MDFFSSAEAEEFNTGNSVITTDEIITAENFLGKDSNIRVLNVDDENMDTVYFVSAQWEEMPGTNKHMSTLFANWLNASVSVDMAILFQGKLLDLISQPSQDGRIIKTGKSAGSLLITLTLPEKITASLVQDISAQTSFMVSQKTV